MADLITAYNEKNDTARTAGEALTGGTMGCVKVSDGLIYKAVDSAGYIMVGVIPADYDSGDKAVLVRPSRALVKNSSNNAVAYGHIGTLCYAETEKIVATSTTTSLIAGRIIDVTTNGVIVDFTQKSTDVASAT